MQPTLDAMAARGTPFSGLLYAGLALTSRGLRVVEFNARFGDPETQVVLALLRTPLAGVLQAAAQGSLDEVPPLDWHPGSAVTVVLAAPGYPEAPSTGGVLTGVPAGADAESGWDAAWVVHAGTAVADGALVATGGRVLCATARAARPRGARERAYELLEGITLEGGHYRRDIGQVAARMTRVTSEHLIPNVLAQRYASAEMVALWSPEHKVRLERDLWIAVLRAQSDLGIPVPAGTIEAYESVRDKIDLASISRREQVTRHDVKARIEEFTRPRRHRAHPQGHDQPGPDRERRADAGAPVAAARARPGWWPHWPGSAPWPPSTPTSR